MNNETRFSHHEPCPKCGSKNNLGVWEDGHKFCFGCRHWEPAIDSLETLGKKVKAMENNYNVMASSGIDSSSFTSSIPKRPMEWLKKYGIVDSEIAYYGVCWNPDRDTLVFPVREEGKIVLTNERYFGTDPTFPKYKTYGHKNRTPLFITNKANPHSLVVVEDAVSAYKLARLVSTLPLFGATMPANALYWASERFKSIRVWLDMDKASQSLLEAAKASQYVPDSRSIITNLDPKEYSMNDLQRILGEYNCINLKNNT
jgi:hypothetical protein